MGVFAKLANALAVPHALLNGLGAIVGGIWLAVLGEWSLIGYGIAMLVGGAFVLGFAMMPGLPLDMLAVASYEKGNKVRFSVLSLLSMFYTNAVLTVWCVSVLYFFVKRADSSSIIPLLLWSYGVATGPIAFLAQKDLQTGNEYAMFSTFFAEVAYILVSLAVLFGRMSVADLFVIFGVVMLVDLAIQFRITWLRLQLASQQKADAVTG